MNIINVNLNDRSYSINIGINIFEKEKIFFPFQKNNQFVLITNNNIAPFWKKKVINYFQKIGIKIYVIIIPDGEKYKTLNQVEYIITKLLNKNYNRNLTLIALGGGVIGDLTGFVASIYQRGVNFIQIPTTLLSQVDASVGGKTGVNHVLGKNMIGSFWQPISVIIDLNTLHTLPKNQLISGLAEVVKYAIIFDYDFFCWLEINIDLILQLNTKSLLYCVQKCCKLKKKVVIKDENDFNDRALLNLGHTFGHAIETHLGYKKILHGESVSIGIIIASYISKLLGYLDKYSFNRIKNLLNKIGLPITNPKNMDFLSYYPYILRDKKNINGLIRLILPLSIGKAKIFENINKDIIFSAIKCI